MCRFLPLTAFSAFLAAGSWLATTSTPAPAIGPGAVIEMHEKLLAALDRGDGKVVADFVAEDRKGYPGPITMYLVDGKGVPVASSGMDGAIELLGRLAEESRRAGGTWKTRLVAQQADCYSPELSYAILELERTHEVDGKTEVKRYRSSSLVRYTEGTWKVFHWHVSPAEGKTPAVSSR